jgi:D-glycero-D-manno-heptose 1,7-bisphosphate phosphatase
MNPASAVFLDRDGVLNAIVERDGKAASPRSLGELRLEPEAPDALARLKAQGFRLFVVTNQPDVARGLMAAEVLDAIHQRLLEALPVEGIRACTHDNADACDCRKPKPGLITGLARDYALDLTLSWMVGDQDRDVACGRNAGVRTILLDRPYNSGAGADHVVATLTEAVAVILSKRGPS